MMHQGEFRNPRMVRYPAAQPVHCYDDGIPFLALEVFHVSLFTVQTALVYIHVQDANFSPISMLSAPRPSSPSRFTLSICFCEREFGFCHKFAVSNTSPTKVVQICFCVISLSLTSLSFVFDCVACSFSAADLASKNPFLSCGFSGDTLVMFSSCHWSGKQTPEHGAQHVSCPKSQVAKTHASWCRTLSRGRLSACHVRQHQQNHLRKHIQLSSSHDIIKGHQHRSSFIKNIGKYFNATRHRGYICTLSNQKFKDYG